FRPIRFSPKFGKANSIVWMIPNERVGAWMPLGRVCSIGFGKQGKSWDAGQRGSQGDASPCIGARGRSPASAAAQRQLKQRLQAAKAVAQWQPTSPAGLAYRMLSASRVRTRHPAEQAENQIR